MLAKEIMKREVSMKARPRLGRGIDALIPADAGFSSVADVIELPLDDIRPNPIQPRKDMGGEKLKELAQSIQIHGLISPILVRRVNSKYEIIAGERRYHACRMAGLQRVPAIIKDVSDDDSFKLSLIENLQREDLNPIEEAEAYATLYQQFGLTHQEIADSVMKDRSTITNSLRLLNLPEEMKASLREGTLTPGHARAILMIDSDDARGALYQQVITKGISVRETERRAALKRSSGPSKPAVDPVLDQISSHLTDLLSTKVTCTWTRKTGRITIEVSTRDDLQRIVSILSKSGDPLS